MKQRCRGFLPSQCTTIGRESIVLGLGTALYLSRILAETGTGPSLWLLVLCLGLACLAVAITVLNWASRLHYRLAPLALCYGYALYPRPHPQMALAIGLTVILALVIANTQSGAGDSAASGGLSHWIRWRPSLSTWLSCLFIFLGSLALYWSTLAPTVLPGDAGEFQLVATLLGVAHPPGYPLYTLLGRLFTFIPLGDSACRVNLLSAVVGALTLTLVALAVRQLTVSLWPGIAAALSLGGATTFWAQATVASIRGLNALFSALIFVLTLGYAHAEGQFARRQRYLAALGLVFGLGISHHGSLGFLVLPVAAYLTLTDRTLILRPTRLLRPVAAAILGLGVLLYLPLRDRMDAPLAPGDLTTLRGFLEHVTARGFRGDMFFFAQPALLPDRLSALRDILPMQFGAPLLLAMLLCTGLFLWRSRPRVSVLFCGALLLMGAVALTYRAPQTVEYLMPAYVCLALLLGGGLGALLDIHIARSGASAILIALTIYLGVAQLMAHYPSFAELHGDHSARTYAEQIFQVAPSEAVILANWHHVNPFRYLQMVEGQRPDITIRYVRPRGSTPPPDQWLLEIDRHIQARDQDIRPVIVTNFYPQFEESHYRFGPLGEAFLVTGPGEEIGNRGAPLDNRLNTVLQIGGEDMVELIGYHLEKGTVSSEDPLVLLLIWRPLSPLERDLSFFAHLVAANGTPLAQADRRYASDSHQPNEVLVDRYTLYLRPAVPPGSYSLIAGAYVPLAEGGWDRLTRQDGTDHILLTAVNVQASSQVPVTLHPWHQQFAGGVTLVGIDYDTSHPQSRRVYLRWHVGAGAPATQARLSSGGQLCSSTLSPGDFSKSTYLSTACDLPLTASSVSLELRRTSDGELLPVLGPWHLGRNGGVELPPAPAGSRFLSLGGEMALVGVRITPGAQVSVRLDLLALRPLSHDYTLSLRLRHRGGEWQVQEDGTPVWGAIPTLKWIRGTRVADVRRVSLPNGASLEQAEIEMLVYDAFTLAPLPPLDERLLAQGLLVSLGEATAETPP